MNKQTLAELSRKSGKSVSTVSKVLRGCSGVDAETRTAVLSARHDEDAPKRKQTGEIHMILPDNPKYFWGDAIREIRKWDSRATVRLKLLSRIGSDQTGALLGEYVEEAVAAKASALILAAHPDEALCRRLAQLAEGRLVIQLCEYTPIPNTFFVGSDPYADGLALSHRLPTTSSPIRIGVLNANPSHTGAERIQGFLKGVGEGAELYFPTPPPTGCLYPARLARALNEMDIPLDYLFCNDGITVPVCDALYKLKDKMHTRLIGFECPPAAETHWSQGRIEALARQDIGVQTALALTLAYRFLTERVYPEQKKTCLPSELLTSKK